jgi:hypothetical protein
LLLPILLRLGKQQQNSPQKPTLTEHHQSLQMSLEEIINSATVV